MAESGNAVVLSYFDALLRESDLDVLKGPHWLNDSIIGFYFEYMNKKIEKLPHINVLLIGPELTQLLKLGDVANYSIFLDPLKAKEKKFLFFPVNDCETKDAAGGSHWSLLVFSRPERTFFHFDSSNGFNKDVSRDFANDLQGYVLGSDKDVKVVNVPCPQQKNGYDCGLFVLCFVDVILEWICESSKVEGGDYQEVGERASKKRGELLELVTSMKGKGVLGR